MRIVVAGVRLRLGGTEVLRDVDLTVNRGVTVLLGPNGAGKASLLRCVVGLRRPDGGTVAVHDDAGRPLADARRSIGYVPQELDVPGEMSLEGLVDYAAWLHRVPRRSRRAAVEQALVAVNLEDRAASRLRYLSGGMRRRALLACALVHDPEVLVCDEATVGLDPVEQHAFRAVMVGQAQERGRVVLSSTHVLDEAATTADDVALLRSGEVVFAGSLDSLVGESAADRTRSLEDRYLQIMGAG